MMQHGCEGEINGIRYITPPVFQGFSVSLNFKLPICCAFTSKGLSSCNMQHKYAA